MNYKAFENLLRNCPKMGIYCFMDSHAKKIFIGCSKDIVTAALGKIRDGYKGFKILEIVTDVNELRFKQNYWMQHYSNKSWDVSPRYKISKYKVRVTLEPVEAVGFDAYECVVRLVNTRYKSFVVARFDNIEVCQAWVKEHYPKGVTNRVYYKERVR